MATAPTRPARPRLSRRGFLRLALLAGIGAGAVAVDRLYRPVGPFNYLRWLARGEIKRRIGPPAIVALGRCPSYSDDVLACLRDLWRQAEMPSVDGKRVLVKPNLVDSIEGRVATTAPQVVGAVVDLLRELRAGEIVVADGPCFRREAWPVVQACGLADVLEARRAQFVDLNYDDPAPVPVRDGWFHRADHLWLPRHVREADLIVSVPKLKTHHWAGVSLSLKNLFGVVPGMVYGWPKNILHMNGIAPSILGLHQSLPPVVAVVDGIVGMEGDGPLFGTPVEHGLLAVGQDALAVDVTCMRAMGLPLDASGHLWLAAWSGMGQAERVEVRGQSLQDLKRLYERPPSS